MQSLSLYHDHYSCSAETVKYFQVKTCFIYFQAGSSELRLVGTKDPQTKERLDALLKLYEQTKIHRIGDSACNIFSHSRLLG